MTESMRRFVYAVLLSHGDNTSDNMTFNTSQSARCEKKIQLMPEDHWAGDEKAYD